MLVHLLEIDSPLVALMPFWSLPCLLKNTNHLSLLICTRCQTQDKTTMYTKFRSSMSTRWRYTVYLTVYVTSLRSNTVKIYGLDTN